MSVQAKIYPSKVVANAGFEHLVALGGPHFIKQAPTGCRPTAPMLTRMHCFALFCFVLCCSCCRVEIGDLKMETAETRKRECFWRHFRQRGDLLVDMNFTVIMSYNMPTVLGTSDWPTPVGESFHLGRSSCLVCVGKTVVHALHRVMKLLWAGRNNPYW